MNRATWAFVLAALLCSAVTASAGTIYEVTAKSDGETITYQVRFGGGFRFDHFTAFDPASKKFVYMSWDRDAQAPEPAMHIWDHRSGETIPLYKFPDVENPLPVISSMEEMKVCPITGDKAFKSQAVIAID